MLTATQFVILAESISSVGWRDLQQQAEDHVDDNNGRKEEEGTERNADPSQPDTETEVVC